MCAPYAIRNNKLKMWKCPLHSSDAYLVSVFLYILSSCFLPLVLQTSLLLNVSFLLTAKKKQPVRRLKTAKTSASDAITHPLLKSVVALEKNVPEMQFRDWTIGGEVHKLPEDGVTLCFWTNEKHLGAEAQGEGPEEYTRQELEAIFSLTELLHEAMQHALHLSTNNATTTTTFLPAAMANINAAGMVKQDQINTVVSALLELADDRTRQMLSDPVMTQMEEATILKALEALVLKRLGQLEASSSAAAVATV